MIFINPARTTRSGWCACMASRKAFVSSGYKRAFFGLHGMHLEGFPNSFARSSIGASCLSEKIATVETAPNCPFASASSIALALLPRPDPSRMILKDISCII